ncbi:MAG: ATP-binding protein [Chloroflexota bacterium]
MSLERYRMIEDWTEADLLALTTGETDEYEFKSSRIHSNDLTREIQVAASAFWNSGGGVLIVGLNDHGQIDGGISDLMGRQRLRDWVDRVISHVEPAGPYFIRLIYGEGADSAIKAGQCVLVIAYGESNNAPHMAPDKRYYVRAGSHSDPAGHFLVESIRARRRLQKPVLRGLLRSNRHNARVVEMLVLALNDAPALDVRLDFDNMPPHARAQFDGRLPLYVPVIDQEHPFTMDASWFGVAENGDPTPPVQLRLIYQDLAGRQYEDTQRLDPNRSIAPLGPSDEADMTTSYTLQDISRQIKRLRKVIEVHPGRPDED